LSWKTVSNMLQKATSGRFSMRFLLSTGSGNSIDAEMRCPPHAY
jgi:hypothetical protein